MEILEPGDISTLTCGGKSPVGRFFCFPFFGGLGKIQVSSLHVATWIADGWASTVACNIYGASSLHWFVLSGKANIVCRLK